MFMRKSELIVLLTVLSIGYGVQNTANASERVIQKEEMPFELCLTVISNSAEKLGIVPEISNVDERKQLAIFSLSDGTLKILCDGLSELLLVSTD